MNKNYAQSFVTSACCTLEQMFGESFVQMEDIKDIPKVDIHKELVVQIHYSGSISGCYLISLDYSTAKFLFVRDGACTRCDGLGGVHGRRRGRLSVGGGACAWIVAPPLSRSKHARPRHGGGRGKER